MTKVAQTPPYCVSCYQQDSNLLYIDFEAAYDGPVIPGSPEPTPVDDLVICEKCLMEAFALVDPEGLHAYVKRLEGVIAAQEQEIEAKERMIAGFNSTVQELLETPVAKHGGRPELQGIPEEVKNEINKRRYGGKQMSRLDKQRLRRQKREKEKATSGE